MTTPTIAATPNGTTTYKFPETKTLQCAFYYEKTVYQSTIFYAATLAKKANALLGSHHLDLRVSPQLPTVFGGGDSVFSYEQTIFRGDDSEATDVFTAAKPAFDPPANMLPVIFCTLVAGGKTAGSTNHVTVGGVSYTIILIFVNCPNPDFVTLLHEIGHAAGLWPTGHPAWDKSNPANPQNFMCTYDGLTLDEAPQYARSVILRDAVTALGTAPFAVRSRDTALATLDPM